MHINDIVPISGEPPVTPEHLAACKRALAAFADENGMPLPVQAKWWEADGFIGFYGEHEGRLFTAGAPKAH